MSRVFLSYRRSDSQDVTGRIFDRLVVHLGRDSVFRDVDSLPAGVDFEERLRQALRETSVVLVLIGPTYLTCTDSDGRRRLFDDPGDPVRREVETALELGLPIIPVTVSLAAMPKQDQLPDAIRALAKMNGLPVRPDPDFDRDVDRLLSQMAPFLGGNVRAELEQRRRSAARIRERLTLVAWQFDSLAKLMDQGSPLVEAAGYIAKEVGQRIGPTLGPQVLRRELAEDRQMALSCAVVGWWQARLSVRMDDGLQQLHRGCADLGGQLDMFRQLTRMLEGICDDGYSPMYFFRVLHETGAVLLRHAPTELSASDTVRSLTTELGSIAAGHFRSRYQKAVKLMNAFIQQAALLFRNAGDDDLVGMSLAATADADRQPGFTERIRALLHAAQDRLPPDEARNLDRLLTEIELHSSKEQALANLERERLGNEGGNG